MGPTGTPHSLMVQRMFDFAAQYEAFRRRDPTLDGVVFVAVKTTGVNCRPVCPARTPPARNVRFYPSAAAAERAGFRPCLRPFCPAWKGTRTTVERALVLIEVGALERNSVDALAARLGVGSRHLSRLFAEHVGRPCKSRTRYASSAPSASWMVRTSVVPLRSQYVCGPSSRQRQFVLMRVGQSGCVVHRR